MNPFKYRSIVEADHHIQNPLSPAKLARVVDYLRLTDGDRIVDVGSGKGSLLLAMAERHRIEAVGLELNPRIRRRGARQRSPRPNSPAP